MAYSPLGWGVLTGKYIKGIDTKTSRLNMFDRFARYSSHNCTEATKRYMEIAEQHNLNVAQIALAFVRQQPFLTSTIIGATSVEQLSENIDSIDLQLNEEIINAINEVHASLSNPAT